MRNKVRLWENRSGPRISRMNHCSVSLLFLLVLIDDHNDACRLQPPPGVFPRARILYVHTTCKHGRKFYEVGILEIHS
jgi:hypothetical protein